MNSQDVAKYANVSQATVSRAFREDVYINPETKKKVLRAAEELGYFPNYSARSLKQRKSGLIGVMLSDADNVFYNVLIKYIEKFFREKGLRLLLTYNDEDPRKERECLESMLSSRVEGAICLPVSASNKDLYTLMKKNGIHIVQVIRRLFQNLDTVTVNDEVGTFIATSHLLDQGHRNILITEYGFNEKIPVKTAGYIRAFTERGLPPELIHILDLPYSVDTSALIAGAIVSNRATAIITSNTLMTISALKAIAAQGLKVPEDISMIAYDDNAWLEFLGISAITHPMEDIGRAMSDLLTGHLEQSEQTESDNTAFVEIKPYLLLRNSTRNTANSQ